MPSYIVIKALCCLVLMQIKWRQQEQRGQCGGRGGAKKNKLNNQRDRWHYEGGGEDILIMLKAVNRRQENRGWIHRTGSE